MTGRKNRALQVPPVVPYKALENFSKALYGTTRGTCSARFFRPVIKNVLPGIIHLNQSYLMKGRLIAETARSILDIKRHSRKY